MVCSTASVLGRGAQVARDARKVACRHTWQSGAGGCPSRQRQGCMADLLNAGAERAEHAVAADAAGSRRHHLQCGSGWGAGGTLRQELLAPGRRRVSLHRLPMLDCIGRQHAACTHCIRFQKSRHSSSASLGASPQRSSRFAAAELAHASAPCTVWAGPRRLHLPGRAFPQGTLPPQCPAASP